MSDETGRGSADPPNEPKMHDRGSDSGAGHNPFPVVGVGASAGGLEAFIQFLSGLPEKPGMAFLLVLHLDPHHESNLSAILARATPMSVVEAAQGMAVRPDHVYVIPPNANMAVAQGILHLTPRPESRRPHLPVDYLFRSLAKDQQARAVAVVLSGTGSDGTFGLCEVKAVGGITFAQDDRSARHSGMPRSAADSGCVDFVLPPDEIARRLALVRDHPYLAPSPVPPEPAADESYRKILAAVRAVTGVDFSMYRDTTIKRRIMRRMALHTQQTLAEYVQHLEADRAEVESLYYDLLINVTSFFRDPELFESLKTRVFPELVKGRPPTEPIRIWVPGCSTGQEAYSLAMTVLEFYDEHPVHPPIQIFATDLSDQTALDRARAGLYPESIEGELSPQRLRRFFKKEDHLYRIDKRIRDICVFARQNITADPPFSHLDLISCRNVLIYLSSPLQRRVVPTFHYALNSPGFLVLGTAETVGDSADLFDLVDRTHKIYFKKSSPTRPHVQFPTGELRAITPATNRRAAPPAPVVHDYQKEADRILLGRYAPPGVLVNDNFDIVQFRGRTSLFLESPPGEPTSNVLKMAREGLFLELRNALTEARSHNQPARRDGIRVRSNGGVHEIAVEVVPVRPQSAGTGCFLVLFQEETPSAATLPAPPGPPGDEAADARELIQLRQELAATREYLQSMIEQQDAANEELRSANEEIMSSNEELQSTNEELETAKEELQSANEELTTVNEQLQHRNVEMSQVNNDLTNLLSSTNIPVIMVGGDLRIRRFTPPAKKAMNLLPSDVGRPVGDIRPAVVVPDLEAMIGEVIETVQPREREVRDRNDRWYSLRIYPYRTSENKIEGAVIVLVDIDQLKRNEQDLATQAAQLQQQASLIELSRDAIIVLDADRKILSWNQGAQETYGWSQEVARGQVIGELLKTVWPTTAEEAYARLDQSGVWNGELQHTCWDGGRVVVESQQVLVRDEKGKPTAILEINHDMTERKKTELALREADRRKDEFLATLAHELRNPIAPIRNAIEIMRLGENDPEALLHVRDLLGRQVKQITRIVDDLIDVSRIVEKKIELRKEHITVASIIETATDTCRSFIETCNHRLDVTIPHEPIYLEADPTRLSQVVINLLNNAAKFTEPGGRISLIVEKEEGVENPGNVLIRVRDNGIGITPDLLPSIFDMFIQGDHSLERARGGLGIGLTLVRSLVQMHGGTTEVHSFGKGQGSEFDVRLPLAEAAPSPKSKPAPPVENVKAQPRRILVVDDSLDQAQSLGMLLRLMGHEVRLAHDGLGALKEAKEFLPEVALVDIGLPGISGYDVARRIREDSTLNNTLLVAQTGWGQEEDRRRSREAGFDYHLVKPVDPQSLQELFQHSPQSRNSPE